MADSGNGDQERMVIDSPKQPKSILKHDRGDIRSGVRWDEMNIMMTYHPTDKDYGHMKIDEPKTPYSYQTEEAESEGEPEAKGVDPGTLTNELETSATDKAATHWVDYDDISDSADEDLPPEERAKRREFKSKRSQHYDEFHKIRLARELIAKEFGEDI